MANARIGSSIPSLKEAFLGYCLIVGLIQTLRPVVAVLMNTIVVPMATGSAAATNQIPP